MSPDSLIHCDSIVKRYQNFEAVKSVSFSVAKGEIFGLLGPNGAGKSTLIKMLYGASPRTSGEMKVLGFDPLHQSHLLKRQLGVVPQENCLDESLTVRENLEMFCRYHSLPREKSLERIGHYLRMFALDSKEKQVIKTLSGGMQRRLAVVRALLVEPQLLILDEPTTGLDPGVRQLLWQKVRELNSQGVSILLTTHYMEEAEILCSRLLILDQGRIVAEGPPKALVEKFASRNLEEVFLKVSGRRLGDDE